MKAIIKDEFRQKLGEALNGNDPEKVVDVFTQYANDLQESIMQDYRQFEQTRDTSILAARGIRQLTGQEKKFYQALLKSVNDGDIKQAFAGTENAYPETTINSIEEGIREQFPLLEAIDFTTVSSLIIKTLKNGSESAFAAWGQLNSAITKELTASVDLIDITLCKLTAWIPISKDMLQAGLEWLDAYVRKLLIEAIGNALSKAVVDGDGKNAPIGMIRDCSATASVQNGVYPLQTAIKIQNLDVATFCALYAALAEDSKGKTRTVEGVIFVVNPIDYYLRILPKIAYRNAAGEYVFTLPLPIQFIQEPTLTQGDAVIGIGKGYNLSLGFGGKEGAITFDDSYQYLEDLRVYATKLHGNGMPKDSNNFIYLDISELPGIELVSTPEEGDNEDETA